MMFGELRYGEKEYQFQIEDMELSMWEKNSKGIPLYFFKEDLKPIDEVLYGTCLPKGNTIAIYVNGFLGTVNNVMRLKVELIVEYVSEKEPIERVSMTGPEINRVFPVGGLIKDNVWNADDNTLSINIKAVESKAHGLTIDDKEVVMKYESSWSFDKKDNEQPIKLISWLTYSFQPEDDLGFIYSVYMNAVQYVSFLCCRENISITEIKLARKNENGKYYDVAKLAVPSRNIEAETNNNAIEKKFISANSIEKYTSELLQLISDGTLYLRHIPQTYSESNRITPARSIMLTAAFEWEFSRLFPNGISHSKETERDNREAKEAIANVIEGQRSKVKRILKNCINHIGEDNLESKIVHALRRYDNAIRAFGERLCTLNGLQYCVEDIGREIAQQRNNFAHGNIDKEFTTLGVISICILSDLVYIMHLRRIGLSEQKAMRNIINQLRGYNLYFENDD